MSYKESSKAIADKITGTRVVVQNKNIAYALSKFKKKVVESEKLTRCMSLQEYIKPSVKKRAQKSNAIRRNKKEQGF